MSMHHSLREFSPSTSPTQATVTVRWRSISRALIAKTVLLGAWAVALAITMKVTSWLIMSKKEQ